MPRTAVVALGGNAITRVDQAGTHAEQAANARALVATIDPYSGDGPHRLELVVLDGDTGTPVETTDRERAFADRAEWLAQRQRWRADIEEGR